MAGMTNRMPELPPDAFRKDDGGDDAAFYAPARLVTHIDEAATRALTDFYRAILAGGGVLLDLMSSWVSHLPEMTFSEVIGQGMNAEELSVNPRLSRSFVQDLNRKSILPLGDNSCDAALCRVGVQYLQHPLEVFAEVCGCHAGRLEVYRAFDRGAQDNKAALKKNGRLTMPVLALGGTKSFFLPIAKEMLAEVAKHVTVVGIPEAGHWIAEENPRAFYRGGSEILQLTLWGFGQVHHAWDQAGGIVSREG